MVESVLEKTMGFREVVIVYKPSRECLELMRRYMDTLRSHGIRVDTIWVDEVGRGDLDTYDLIIAMGGDGTLLRISWSLCRRRPLILPVPCGRRTVLYEDIACIKPDTIIEKVLRGEFFIDRLERIKAVINNREYYALNEVALISQDSGRVLHIDVSIETPFNKTVYRLESDGVLVSTPTGSSAYCLSARGPLVETLLSNIILVPLNPVTLNTAPLILHPFSQVVVRVHDYTNAYVDGKRVDTLAPDSIALFRLSNSFLRIIRISRRRDLVKSVLGKRITLFL